MRVGSGGGFWGNAIRRAIGTVKGLLPSQRKKIIFDQLDAFRKELIALGVGSEHYKNSNNWAWKTSYPKGWRVIEKHARIIGLAEIPLLAAGLALCEIEGRSSNVGGLLAMIDVVSARRDANAMNRSSLGIIGKEDWKRELLMEYVQAAAKGAGMPENCPLFETGPVVRD